MMAETPDDVTVKGFDNPVFEDDDKAGGTARLNVNQASNDEVAANQARNGSKKDHEAVNLELVTMTPEKNGNGADIKSKDAAIDVTYHDDGEGGQNKTHRKMVRGEKYYPGGREGTAKQRWICWGGILAVVLTVIIFIILLSTGVFSSDETAGNDTTVNGDTQAIANVQPSGGGAATSNTPPPPPTTPIVDSVFSGSLRLNEEFRDALYDKNSPEFMQMKRTVEDQLDEAYSVYNWPEGSDLGTIRTQVNGFSPGSVVVDYDVAADHIQSVSPEEASSRLERRLEQYLSAGQLPASEIIVKPMEDLCAMGQSGCSHECNFSFTSLEFVCLCPTGMEIGDDLQNCVFAAPAIQVQETHPDIHHIEDPVLEPSLHPDSTYTVDHEWIHEDGETTTEPEPETTAAPHDHDHDYDYDHDHDHHFHDHDLFGDMGEDTTPEPEPETTAMPLDHEGWFGLVDHSAHEHGETTTPKPEPETTPEPEPQTTAQPDDLLSLFGEEHPETTPEPEPETTAEPGPETTAYPVEEAVSAGVAPTLDAARPQFVPSLFDASLRLDEKFPEALHDNTSADYLKMIVRVKKEMAEAFSGFNWSEGGDLGQIGIKVEGFEPGSILVHYQITTGDVSALSAEEVAQRLQHRLEDYFTSEEGRRYHGARFPVSDIMVEPIRDLCASGQSGCSHKCYHSAVDGTFLCHCPEGMELGDDAKTCMHLHGVPPVVTVWDGQQWTHPDDATTAEPESQPTDWPFTDQPRLGADTETTAKPETTAAPHDHDHDHHFHDHGLFGDMGGETTPEPEPETTATPHDHDHDHQFHGHGLFGDMGGETTPEPEPETTAAPHDHDHDHHFHDHDLFGDMGGETTPEPEPETTATPHDHDHDHHFHDHGLFGDMGGETTPEPEAETTPEPDSQTTAEQQAETALDAVDLATLLGAALSETTSESEPASTEHPDLATLLGGAVPGTTPESTSTEHPDLATLLGGAIPDTTPEPEPTTTAEPEPQGTTLPGEPVPVTPVPGAETTTAAEEATSGAPLDGETTTPGPESETTPSTPDQAALQPDGDAISLHEKLSLMNAMGIAPEWESHGAETTPEPETETTAEPAPTVETAAAEAAGGDALMALEGLGAAENGTEAQKAADGNEVSGEPVNPPSLMEDEMHHGERHEEAELLPVNNSLDDRRRAKVLEKMAEEANATEPTTTAEPEQGSTTDAGPAADGVTTPAPGAGEAAEATTTPEPEPASGTTEGAPAGDATTPEPEPAATEVSEGAEAAVESTTPEPAAVASEGDEGVKAAAGDMTTPEPESTSTPASEAVASAGDVTTTPEPEPTTDAAAEATEPAPEGTTAAAPPAAAKQDAETKPEGASTPRPETIGATVEGATGPLDATSTAQPEPAAATEPGSTEATPVTGTAPAESSDVTEAAAPAVSTEAVPTTVDPAADTTTTAAPPPTSRDAVEEALAAAHELSNDLRR